MEPHRQFCLCGFISLGNFTSDRVTYLRYLKLRFIFILDKRMKSYYTTYRTKSYLEGKWMNHYEIAAINKINYLSSEIEALYHQASLKLGISDSVSIVLYTIYDQDGSCLLSDIYKKSGISKQTINSAVRRLEADNILYLEQYTGRAKRAILTDKGKDYARQTVGKLYEAEVRAFDTWQEEEISLYIQLMEKYNHCLRQQIEKMEKRNYEKYENQE